MLKVQNLTSHIFIKLYRRSFSSFQRCGISACVTWLLLFLLTACLSVSVESLAYVQGYLFYMKITHVSVSVCCVLLLYLWFLFLPLTVLVLFPVCLSLMLNFPMLLFPLLSVNIILTTYRELDRMRVCSFSISFSWLLCLSFCCFQLLPSFPLIVRELIWERTQMTQSQ